MNTVIRKIGNSEGVIIPKEILESLGLKAGDAVFLTALRNSIQIRPVEDAMDDFERNMQVAREGMDKYKVALRALAKL
jgi:putative addiction module antidote